MREETHFQLELQLREQERVRSLLRYAVGQARRAVQRAHETRRDTDSKPLRGPVR